jgi:ABC-type Mn2+/Zn2+ transport system permease subunit
MKASILIISIVVAVFRPFLIFYDVNEHLKTSYEAVSHILVGGLLAAFFANRRVFKQPGGAAFVQYKDFAYMLWAAIGISVVEIVCAIANVFVG